MNGSDIESATFGPFQLSPTTREIQRDGSPVELGDRALDILIALIEHAGEIVSHRDLIARVWRGQGYCFVAPIPPRVSARFTR